MPLLDLVILALIQGIAEFLPISSSAHLILFPALTGEADQGLVIDAAVHVGTLAAVMLYFRSETARLFRGMLALARGRARDEDARLVLMLALATVPVVVVGAAIAVTGLDVALRSVALIAWTTIVFAIVLWLTDRFGGQGKMFGAWRAPGAVAMGLAQAISIIPGVSRSGVTMSAARAMGYGRIEAARLSLMMSIPATMAVGGYLALKLVRAGDASVGADALAAAAFAFLSALLALAFLMRMLRDWSMTPFVLYRLALGGFLLWFAYA